PVQSDSDDVAMMNAAAARSSADLYPELVNQGNIFTGERGGVSTQFKRVLPAIGLQDAELDLPPRPFGQVLPGSSHFSGLFLRGHFGRTSGYDFGRIQFQRGNRHSVIDSVRRDYQQLDRLAMLFGHGDDSGKQALFIFSKQARLDKIPLSGIGPSDQPDSQNDDVLLVGVDLVEHVAQVRE